MKYSDRKMIKSLKQNVETLQQLRALDAEQIKDLKMANEKLRISDHAKREQAKTAAIEALAHLAEAVSKTVLSADKNL